MTAFMFRPRVEPLLPETTYVKLVELANKAGGDLYDYGYIEPHRTYRILREQGLVQVTRKYPDSPRWQIARLTAAGEQKVGMNNIRRRRRRRHGR